MKALVYGVKPDPVPVRDGAGPREAALANTPMRLEADAADPEVKGPGWCVVATRLTGICGSDFKQVVADFGDSSDSPLAGNFSLPQVLGHECVGEVAEVGPGVEDLEVGQRVVLNPWLSCEPRGVEPVCPSCEAGDYSLCWNFQVGPLAPGIHTGTCRDAWGGYAQRWPAHRSMLIPVPDDVPDEAAVLSDPFAVSLHSVTRNPPEQGGRAVVIGAGALGSSAVAILRALHPDVDVAVVSKHPAQTALAERLGADLVLDSGQEQLEIIEQLTDWSGGRLMHSPIGVPMAHPGEVDVVYDTVGKPDTLEIGARVLRARGTLVQSGVHGNERWERMPVYFKELHFVGSNAFGVEEVEGVRKHGIEHHLDLVRAGRIDLRPMLTHRFALDDWREAFTTLIDRGTTGAVKVAFDGALTTVRTADDGLPVLELGRPVTNEETLAAIARERGER